MGGAFYSLPDLGIVAGVQDTYKTLRDMNKRQVLTQLLALGLIVTSALMIWKVRSSEMRGSPVV